MVCFWLYCLFDPFFHLKERFTQDTQPHYIYSPREMTRWVRGIFEALRPLETLPVEGLIRIWAHEALRLFQDRWVQVLSKLYESVINCMQHLDDAYEYILMFTCRIFCTVIWSYFKWNTLYFRLVGDEERRWTDENINMVALKHFPNIDKEKALNRPILYSNWLSKVN